MRDAAFRELPRNARHQGPALVVEDVNSNAQFGVSARAARHFVIHLSVLPRHPDTFFACACLKGRCPNRRPRRMPPGVVE